MLICNDFVRLRIKLVTVFEMKFQITKRTLKKLFYIIPNDFSNKKILLT